jgi:hypothetical protein
MVQDTAADASLPAATRSDAVIPVTPAVTTTTTPLPPTTSPPPPMTTLLFGLHPQRPVLMSVMKTRKELCVREMIVTARAVSFVQACTLFKFHSLSLYLCISVSPPLFLLVKLMVCVIEGI